MTDSFAKTQQFQAAVTGEAVHVIPFADSLTLLKSLKGLAPDDAGIKLMIEEETRYLRRAINGIATMPLLQQTFGHGLGAAMELAPLLRQRQAAKTMDSVLDTPGLLPDQREYVKDALKTGIKFK